MKFMLSLVIIPLSYAFNVNTSAPKQSYYFTYIGGPFPKDVYNAWSGTYPLVSITRGVRIKVEYKVLSSGEGKHALIKKQSSFAATETGLITNDEIREGEGKLRVFPVAAGSVFFLINYKVTIGYNIPGFQSLILNREILVGIFNGTINEWGHSDILALNPSLRTVLNGHSPAITIIKRREEISGTTSIISRALSSFSPEWNSKYGTFSSSSRWPRIKNDVYKEGNKGISVHIIKSDYSLGYIKLELSAKYDIHLASLVNKFGSVIPPTMAGITAAVVDVVHKLPENPEIGSFIPVVDSSAQFAYPLVGLVYNVLRTDWPLQTDHRYEILRYILWTLTDSHSKKLAKNNFFTSLPPTLLDKSIAILGSVWLYNETDSVEVKGTGPNGAVTMLDKVLFDQIKEEAFNNRIACGKCDHGTCISTNMCLCQPGYIGTDCNTHYLPTFISSWKESHVLAALAVVNFLLLLLVIGSLIFLTVFRNVDLIRASSSDLSYLILAFLAIGHAAGLVEVLAPTIHVCRSKIFLLPVAVTGITFAFLLKLWRAVYVCGSNSSTVSVAITQPSRMLAYILIFTVFIMLLATIWTIADPYEPTLLKDVDIKFFYLSCASQNTLIPFTIMAIIGLVLCLLLCTILYLSLMAKTIPYRMEAVKNVLKNVGHGTEYCYVMVFFLSALLLNNQIMQSEHQKTIIHLCILMLLLLMIHAVLFFPLFYKVYLYECCGSSREEMGLKSPIDTLDEITYGRSMNQQHILESNCSRISNGFLKSWKKEIIFYDTKSNLMSFECDAVPGSLDAFVVPSKNVTIRTVCCLNQNPEVPVEFQLIHHVNGKKYTIVLAGRPHSSNNEKWINLLVNLTKNVAKNAKKA